MPRHLCAHLATALRPETTRLPGRVWSLQSLGLQGPVTVGLGVPCGTGVQGELCPTLWSHTTSASQARPLELPSSHFLVVLPYTQYLTSLPFSISSPGRIPVVRCL